MPARVALLLTLLAVPVAAPAAPPDVDKKDVRSASALSEKEAKELETLSKQFLADKSRAQATAAAAFDVVKRRMLSRPGMTPAAKRSLEKSWDQDKTRFMEADELPKHSDLARVGLDYGINVSKRYRPLWAKYGALVKAAMDRKDTAAADALLKHQKDFEEKFLPGRRAFAANTVWKGERTYAKNTVPCVLRVGPVNGVVFDGMAAQNMGVANHPRFKIKGELVGMEVAVESTKVEQGKVRGLKLTGVVLGSTMVLSDGTGSVAVLAKE